MKKAVLILIALACAVSIHAIDLSLGKDDLRIVQSPEGGYHLYIRAKSDIKSVLLTETTRDPELKSDNYAYRAPEWNPVNGDEKRMLDGAFIPAEKKIYSLIDSTPEKDTPIGEAFHIWIPYLISYGYDGPAMPESFSAYYFDITAGRCGLTGSSATTVLPPHLESCTPWASRYLQYMKDTVSYFTSWPPDFRRSSVCKKPRRSHCTHRGHIESSGPKVARSRIRD